MALRTRAFRPAGVEMSSPTRTSRFGPVRATDLTPERVWQTEHERANSSRPVCSFAFSLTPPTPTLALWSLLKATTIAGTARPKANRTRTPAMTDLRLALVSACSDARMPRGPPRIAAKKTNAAARIQMDRKMMTMREGNLPAGEEEVTPAGPRAGTAPPRGGARTGEASGSHRPFKRREDLAL